MAKVLPGLATLFVCLLARLLGLRLGIDVAWGPEDTAIYLTVGHSWST